MFYFENRYRLFFNNTELNPSNKKTEKLSFDQTWFTVWIKSNENRFKEKNQSETFSSTFPFLSHVLLVPAESVLSNNVQLSEVVDDHHCSPKPERILLSRLVSFTIFFECNFCWKKIQTKF